MAKAHAGLPPSNLPDAGSAAIPADQLQAGDPIGQMVDANGNPIQQVDANGNPIPPANTGGEVIGGQPTDLGISPLEPQQPAQEEPRSAKTIGDILSGIFGGGN
jgi:hypothetical protein